VTQCGQRKSIATISQGRDVLSKLEGALGQDEDLIAIFFYFIEIKREDRGWSGVKMMTIQHQKSTLLI